MLGSVHDAEDAMARGDVEAVVAMLAEDEACYRRLDVLTLSADGTQIEQVTSFIARSGEALTPEELARFPDEAVDAAKVRSIFTHCGLPDRLD